MKILSSFVLIRYCVDINLGEITLCIGHFLTNTAHFKKFYNNTDYRENFGHYNRDTTFSHCFISGTINRPSNKCLGIYFHLTTV